MPLQINFGKTVIKGGRRELCACALARHYIALGGAVRYRGKPYREVYALCAEALPGIARDRILVVGDGQPAFVDFQLAWHAPARGRLFCILAYDDLRHLLKHKRSYCASELTQRERQILARPSLPSRLWMRVVKPPYLFLTRRVLGWADREGASDRGERR